MQSLINNVKSGKISSIWSYENGLVLYKNRVYLDPNSSLTRDVMMALHNQGHEGYQKTLFRIAADFYWPGIKKSSKISSNVVWFVKKTSLRIYNHLGCYNLYKFPYRYGQIYLWISSMPYPRHLENCFDGCGGSIFQVCALYSYGSSIFSGICCENFFDQIFKLHGLPETIVSDRDVTFTSSLWTEIFRLSGTKLIFISAYHPQSDGQTEVVNRTIEVYLRCFTSDQPRKWMQWISWAEYCYNTSYHSSLKTTPFEVVYRRAPPRLLNYCSCLARVEVVDQELKTRDQVVSTIRERLLQAQNIMKNNFDRSHREVLFEVGDLVLLKLKPYRQLSLTSGKNKKVSPRYYGTFLVEAKIGKVAYRLQLPQEVKIHTVFHVSCLKKFHGTLDETTPTYPTVHQGEVVPTPKAVLEKKVIAGEYPDSLGWLVTF